jgi:hypothetical protein
MQANAQSQKGDRKEGYQRAPQAPITLAEPVLSLPLTLPFQPVEFVANLQAYDPSNKGDSRSDDQPIWCGIWAWMTDWLRRWARDPLTVITTILVALTGRYVINSSHQTKALTKSVELTRKDFNATHRPKLVIRQAFSLITDPDEATILVRYVIANVGGTRCWMTECHLGIELVPEIKYPLFLMTPDMAFPSNVPHIGAIGPGERKTIDYVHPTRRWDIAHREGFDAPAGVHFVGHIAYIDEAGSNIRYHMAFRWRYDIETQRFHRIWEAENEHEYAD